MSEQPNYQKMGICQTQIFPRKKKKPPIKIKGAGLEGGNITAIERSIFI